MKKGTKSKKEEVHQSEEGKEPEPDEEPTVSVVERDSIVVLKDGNGQQADFIVMGSYNKFYNKWFLASQDDKQALSLEQKNKKAVHLHFRKIEHDPAKLMIFTNIPKWKEMLLLMKCSNKLSFLKVKSLKSRASSQLSMKTEHLVQSASERKQVVVVT